MSLKYIFSDTLLTNTLVYRHRKYRMNDDNVIMRCVLIFNEKIRAKVKLSVLSIWASKICLFGKAACRHFSKNKCALNMVLFLCFDANVAHKIRPKLHLF